MMVGIVRIPTFQVPQGRKCDDCNARFMDRDCIEVRGAVNALYLHQKCAEDLARDFLREVERA